MVGSGPPSATTQSETAESGIDERYKVQGNATGKVCGGGRWCRAGFGGAYEKRHGCEKTRGLERAKGAWRREQCGKSVICARIKVGTVGGTWLGADFPHILTK